MEATLIDRNYEFRPHNMNNFMSNHVTATVGVVCETNDELLFLLQHLSQFDIKKEYNASLPQDVQDPVTDVEHELQEFMGNVGSISSLEVD